MTKHLQITVLAMLAVTLCATVAPAGLTYTIQAVVEREGEISRFGERVIEDGERARIDFLDDAGKPDGSYLITIDGGKTFVLGDGEKAVCARWSASQFWATAGGVLENAQRFANAKLSDAKVVKVLDEAGPEIHGFATRHVRLVSTYGAEARLLFFKFHYAVEEIDDLWMTDALDLPVFEDAWERASLLTGFEYADAMSRTWLSHVVGPILKSRNVVHLKNLKSGEETVKRHAVEVTALDEVDAASIPAATFEVPDCEQVSEKEMERVATKTLKKHVK